MTLVAALFSPASIAMLVVMDVVVKVIVAAVTEAAVVLVFVESFCSRRHRILLLISPDHEV